MFSFELRYNDFKTKANRQGSLYSFLYDFHHFLFLVISSHAVAVEPFMEWNLVKKTRLVTKLYEQQNSSFGLIKFIWLCGLEREYFASSTNWTWIHTQTIMKPRPYFCHQNRRVKVERTYKNWIIQLRPQKFKHMQAGGGGVTSVRPFTYNFFNLAPSP